MPPFTCYLHASQQIELSGHNWLFAFVSMSIYLVLSARCHAVRDAEDTGGRVGFWNIGVEKPHPHPDAIKLEQALHWLPRQIQHKAWALQEDARLKHAVLRFIRVRPTILLAIHWSVVATPFLLPTCLPSCLRSSFCLIYPLSSSG